MDYWDFVQDHRIRRTDAAASRANRTADRARASAEELEERLDRLALITRAMWNLLGAKGGVTEDELVDEMHRVDLLDGQLDGKAGPVARDCPSCERPNGAMRRHCLYCGHDLPDGSVFDGV